jgi:hypothetical protein
MVLPVFLKKTSSKYSARERIPEFSLAKGKKDHRLCHEDAPGTTIQRYQKLFVEGFIGY